MVKRKQKLQTVADGLCGQSSTREETMTDVLRGQSFSREETVATVLRGQSFSREKTNADVLRGQSFSREKTMADVLRGQSSSHEKTMADVLRGQSSSCEKTMADVLRGQSSSREKTMADVLRGQSSSHEKTMADVLRGQFSSREKTMADVLRGQSSSREKTMADVLRGQSFSREETMADVLRGQSFSREETVANVLRDQSFSREETVANVLHGQSFSFEETVANVLRGQSFSREETADRFCDQSSSCEDTDSEPDMLERAIAIATHIPTSSDSGNAPTRWIGLRQLGSGIKANVLFDDSGYPVGKGASQLKSALGQLVRNGTLFPLTYSKWKNVPKESKDFIWHEVQENLTMVPSEFKDVCFSLCGKIWRNHKSKTKSMYFNPYMENPSILSITPPGIVEEQWKQMVLYWLSDRGKAISLRQSRNRAKMGPYHTAGRIDFSQLRYKIQQERGNVDKMSLYLASHDINNPEVAAFAAEYEKKLCDIQDADRTVEARDCIYDEIYSRTFRKVVKKPKVSSAVYEAEIAKLKTTQDSMMQDIAFLRERLTSIESQGKSLESRQEKSLESQQQMGLEVQQGRSSESQQGMSSDRQHVMTMYTRALRSQSTMPKKGSLQTPVKTSEKNKKKRSPNSETRGNVIVEEVLPVKKRKKADDVEKYEKLIEEAKLKAKKTTNKRLKKY